MGNTQKSVGPSNRGNEILISDQDAFDETIGKQAEIMGAHPGTNKRALVKRFFNKNKNADCSVHASFDTKNTK